MDTVTGRVSVTRSLDREVIAQYRLKCYAVDTSGRHLEKPVDLVVDVTDVKDNRPTFAKEVFHGSVVEGSPQGTFVMRVVASDMDDPLTLNGAIRYHIVLQVPMMTAHRVFTIDRFTGIITNTVRLDRERVAHFSLVVMASDMEGDANIGLSTTATAIVTITDINDIAPEFTRRTWFGTVRENAVGVPVTMPPLSVIDSDEAGTAAWRVHYSLRGGGQGGGEWGAGDPGDLFVVETDPGTNNGRIVVVKPLDFETSSSYQLIVFVDNEEPLVKTVRPPPESTATVTVSVEDENEAPLFEPRLQQVMLAEGLALGSAVTTLVARDPDTAQKQSLRYRKLRVPGDWLDIDAAGGAVSTAAELDRESPLVQRNVYTATFLATDDGSPVASGTATLELLLSDVNDNAPTAAVWPRVRSPVASGTATLELLLSDVNDNAPTAAVWPRETAACPRTGVAVVASDADEDPNGRPFRFWLAPGGGGDDDWTLRQVDGNSSQLLAKSSLAEGLHWVALLVGDSGTPPLSAVRQLQVALCAACDRRGRCLHASAASGAASAVSAMVILLGVLGSLLLALKRRRHGDKVGRWSLVEPRGDAATDYTEQGGGEEDRDYDATLLRFEPPPSSPSPPSPPCGDCPGSLCLGETVLPRDMAAFIGKSLRAADADEMSPPYDSLAVFAYEGSGSEAGSLSSRAH
ncbi:cadherin-2-like [Petromyzon marinus]|uniref:cadherin-2-like n=1 Tax=Petromyzon marinus TaxID=7757 RepID=UPI003F70A9DE